MKKINTENTELVTVQFTGTKPNFIPKYIIDNEMISNESLDNFSNRVTNKSTGKIEISPTENVDVSPLVVNLARHGFKMIGFKGELRYREDDLSLNSTYYVLTFTFSKSERKLNAEIEKHMEGILASLSELANRSYWKVQVFNNPYFSQGKTIEGKRTASILLGTRVPLFNPDGTKRKVRRHLSDGTKSLHPDFLQPNHIFDLDDEGILIKEFQSIAVEKVAC